VGGTQAIIKKAGIPAGKRTKTGISRRRFLRYGLEAGAATALTGVLMMASTGKAYVRPPGALPETDFSRLCMRCGTCVEVCPTRALQQLDLSLDFKNLGTPVLNPDHGGCIAWGKECLRCVEACPTQALSGENPLTKQPLGRIRINEPICYNCMLCFRKCPIKGAILFPNPKGDPFKEELGIPTDLIAPDSPLKPYIDDSLCTGCGLCVYYCPPKAMTLSPLGP
jgi:ferredoxin-type protein NapG